MDGLGSSASTGKSGTHTDGFLDMKGTIVQVAFVLYWEFCYLIALLLIAALLYPKLARPRSAGSILALVRTTNWAAVDSAIIVLAVAHFVFYLLVPSFADYGEPTIPLLASNYLHGIPVYSDWGEGQAVVGSNYGPYIFLAQIPVLLWHPTIAGAKCVGIFSSLGALCILGLAVKRRSRSSADALAMCALAVAMLAFELHYWFFDRPDPLLIACVSLGALLFDRTRPVVCLLGLALFAGIATNLKLFGAVYLLPLAVACVPKIRSAAVLAGAVAAGGVLFLITLALPFLVGVSSLPAYLANLRMMPHQGFLLGASLQSLLYGMIILTLPILALLRRDNSAEDRIMLLTAIACTGVVALIAAKPGGGPPYMMPFVPLSVYLAARMSAAADPALRRTVFGAVVLCALPIWAYSWFQMVKQVPAFRTEQAKQAEVRELLLTFPGAEFGHNSGVGATADEMYRVEKAFLGQITRFDYVNFADQRAAGLSASILYPLFHDCKVPTWILSRRGGRLLGTVPSSSLRLLDKAAVERFEASYEQVKVADFYEVWRCKSRH